MKAAIVLFLLALSSISFAKNSSHFPTPCSCHIWVDKDHSYFADGDDCQMAVHEVVTKCSQDFEAKICEKNISSCTLDDGEYPWPILQSLFKPTAPEWRCYAGGITADYDWDVMLGPISATEEGARKSALNECNQSVMLKNCWIESCAAR